jgi:hypothetical protein
MQKISCASQDGKTHMHRAGMGQEAHAYGGHDARSPRTWRVWGKKHTHMAGMGQDARTAEGWRTRCSCGRTILRCGTCHKSRLHCPRCPRLRKAHRRSWNQTKHGTMEAVERGWQDSVTQHSRTPKQVSITHALAFCDQFI